MDGQEHESPLVQNRSAAALTDLLPPMTENAVALYEFLAMHGGRIESDAAATLGLDCAHLDAALHVLRAHRLVRPAPDGDGCWDTVGPECAVVDLIFEEEARLQRAQATLVKAREKILGLLPSYLDGLRQRTPSNAIDVVQADAGTVVKLLVEHFHAATTDVRVIDPAREVAAIRWLFPVAATNAHGPAIRLVLDQAMRHDSAARRQLALLCDGGAQVRTTGRESRWLVVFDRRTALVPLGERHEPVRGIAVVRNSAVVESLSAAFELLWDSAQSFAANGCGHDGDSSDELRLEILRHLAAGKKDEVVARRLGLSVRTCRRHIAEVMERLGAESRFQAGVLAEREIFRRGLLGGDR
ncbi:MAG: hypothetical protein V7603_4618 [Micromonosporaceae bacterium]